MLYNMLYSGVLSQDVCRITQAVWQEPRFTRYFLERYGIKDQGELFDILESLPHRPVEIDHLIHVLDEMELT